MMTSRLLRRHPIRKIGLAPVLLKVKHSGQALVLFAIMILTLLAGVALAIDTGMIWMNRRILQNSVDAAALAGAWELPNEASAKEVACDYAWNKNGVTGMSGSDCNGKADVFFSKTYLGGSAPINDTITVVSYKTVIPTIGSLFGWDAVRISADASAVIGSIKSDCVFPLWQTEDLLQTAGAWTGTFPNMVQLNVPVIMKTSAQSVTEPAPTVGPSPTPTKKSGGGGGGSDDSGSYKGNFLALQVVGPGGRNFRDLLANPNGCEGGRLTDVAETETGNLVGPFDKGMADRAKLWSDSDPTGNCPMIPQFNDKGEPVHADGTVMTPENCYRMVRIVLLEGTSPTFHGHETRKIRGFLVFYIANWCGQSSNPSKKAPEQTCKSPGTVTVNGTTRTMPDLKWGELWGFYVRYEEADPDAQPYDGLGTKVVVLID